MLSETRLNTGMGDESFLPFVQRELGEGQEKLSSDTLIDRGMIRGPES
jgi:hypothetical protein